MGTMFMGVSTHNLDQKNRLAVPSRFRDDLGGTFIVTRPLTGKSKCLYIFTLEKFEKLYDTIRERAEGEFLIALERKMFMNADKVESDNQGRFTINPALSAFAGLDKSVIVQGAGERIEIWSTEHIGSVTEQDDEIIAQNDTSWVGF